MRGNPHFHIDTKWYDMPFVLKASENVTGAYMGPEDECCVLTVADDTAHVLALLKSNSSPAERLASENIHCLSGIPTLSLLFLSRG